MIEYIAEVMELQLGSVPLSIALILGCGCKRSKLHSAIYQGS